MDSSNSYRVWSLFVVGVLSYFDRSRGRGELADNKAADPTGSSNSVLLAATYSNGQRHCHRKPHKANLITASIVITMVINTAAR